MNHLVFYDGECGLCDQFVQILLKIDRHQIFCFAPLQGETAKQFLAPLPEEFKKIDSFVLVENFQTRQPKYFVMGKGIFRVFWLLGGIWAIPGAFHFLPSWLYDWGYRFVAKNRHRLFKNQSCVIPSPEQKKRFLP